jgi:hypothetical protein
MPRMLGAARTWYKKTTATDFTVAVRTPGTAAGSEMGITIGKALTSLANQLQSSQNIRSLDGRTDFSSVTNAEEDGNEENPAPDTCRDSCAIYQCLCHVASYRRWMGYVSLLHVPLLVNGARALPSADHHCRCPWQKEDSRHSLIERASGVDFHWMGGGTDMGLPRRRIGHSSEV